MTACLAVAARSPVRWGTHRGQHPRDERQQFLKRVEMGGLSGHHMFDSSRYAPLRNVSVGAEVHNKRPVR